MRAVLAVQPVALAAWLLGWLLGKALVITALRSFVCCWGTTLHAAGCTPYLSERRVFSGRARARCSDPPAVRPALMWHCRMFTYVSLLSGTRGRPGRLRLTPASLAWCAATHMWVIMTCACCPRRQLFGNDFQHHSGRLQPLPAADEWPAAYRRRRRIQRRWGAGPCAATKLNGHAGVSGA